MKPPDFEEPESHPVVTSPPVSSGHPPAVESSMDGGQQPVTVPDAQTRTEWCAKCKADVVPRGKGPCPRCGRVLKNSFLARKHPVNMLRREQLLAENIAEYKPGTLHLRRACR